MESVELCYRCSQCRQDVALSGIHRPWTAVSGCVAALAFAYFFFAPVGMPGQKEPNLALPAAAFVFLGVVWTVNLLRYARRLRYPTR
jgi:hypothetical protein